MEPRALIAWDRPLPAPAKINLFLEVQGRHQTRDLAVHVRQDGGLVHQRGEGHLQQERPHVQLPDLHRLGEPAAQRLFSAPAPYS